MAEEEIETNERGEILDDGDEDVVADVPDSGEDYIKDE